MSGANPTERTIPAVDDFPIAATIFEPADGQTEIVLQINSATSVPRRLYRRFGAFLASEGITVVTYDYRGIGGSKPEKGRGKDISATDWGTKDAAGVLSWIGRELAPRRTILLGHSIGGQLIGLMPNNTQADKTVLVAAQSGYFGLWPAIARMRFFFIWYLLVPATVRACGYLPGWKLGGGENLPGGVALEWARWCRHPDYLVDAGGNPVRDGFERVRGPLRAYGITDDGFAPEAAVDELLSWYRAADIDRRFLSPRAFDLSKLGHFNFFREAALEPVWSELADWIKT